MAQQELLISVVRAIENAGVEYILTGSIVSSLQGEPRSTHDIGKTEMVGNVWRQ